MVISIEKLNILLDFIEEGYKSNCKYWICQWLLMCNKWTIVSTSWVKSFHSYDWPLRDHFNNMCSSPSHLWLCDDPTTDMQTLVTPYRWLTPGLNTQTINNQHQQTQALKDKVWAAYDDQSFQTKESVAVPLLGGGDHISHKTLLYQINRHYCKQLQRVLECAPIHHGRSAQCFPTFLQRKGSWVYLLETGWSQFPYKHIPYVWTNDKAEKTKKRWISSFISNDSQLFHAREKDVIHLCLLAFSVKRENKKRCHHSRLILENVTYKSLTKIPFNEPFHCDAGLCLCCLVIRLLCWYSAEKHH